MLVKSNWFLSIGTYRRAIIVAEEIVIALIGFAGAVIGSALGVVASAKLTNYRLEQLEKKVNLHNNVIERVYNLERNHAVLEQRVEDLHSEG